MSLFRFAVASGLALALPLAPASLAARPAATTLSVKGDRTIDRTTRLSRLVIAPGATLSAPAGSNLTMTVDGVGMAMRPGTYRGNVVLTVTQDIPVTFGTLPPHHFRAGVYVDDGRYVAAKSVAAAVRGTVNGQTASNVAITSREPLFNGILVAGTSRYVINNPVITLTGNGGDDFAGFGAAIMSTGQADVTVNNARITTTGAVRTGIFVGGHSTMHVNNSFIDVRNGTLPPDYKFTIDVGKMMEVPWMLGLSGNVRATNLVDNATVYYTNSHIRAEGWGAMSTDVAEHVRMYVKDCLIETIDSGYGAYSIGDSLDHFSHTTFNVADMALIMAAEGSGTFTDGTVVNSRRFGVLMHSGGAGGVLRIEGKSVFNTRSTAIQVKGRGATVVVDDARIIPANGILLQAMVNDDPFAGGPGAGPIIGVQGAAAAPAPSAPANPADLNPPVIATFSNATLTGDVLNTRTAQGDLRLTLDHARLTGAVSTGQQAPASGQAPTRETYRQIGEVVNTLGPTPDAYGLQLTLGDGAVWTATRTSYLTRLDIAPGARITGAGHARVRMTVDGAETSIAPGSYRGAIVVEVGATS